MPGWVWAVIAVGVVVVLALIAWQLMRRRETDRLKGQFGPEYDRTLESTESKRKAEAELAARQERREKLAIRPLSQPTRARYLESWRVVQAQFVDDPGTAVIAADSLIQSVMAERGYPVEDFEQRAADVSVDHPDVVENYREGHRLAVARGSGASGTENLRQAMRHYRALFDELLDGGGDSTAAWDPTANGALSTAGDREASR
jgi:hypothetical protein